MEVDSELGDGSSGSMAGLNLANDREDEGLKSPSDGVAVESVEGEGPGS